MDEKTELLRQIKEEVINLKGSPLALARVKNEVFPVIGEGNHDADIMFIGEAPGRNEAETGRPFCGAAGRVLDELLLSINVPRKDVYITNIVKDRPPLNRDPEPEEINVYAPFLDRQVAVIQPKAHADDFLLAWRQILKHVPDVLLHDLAARGIGRGNGFVVLDEKSEGLAVASDEAQ